MKRATVVMVMLSILSVDPAYASSMENLLKLCSQKDSHADMRQCLEEKASSSESALKAAESSFLGHVSKRNEVDYAATIKKAVGASEAAFKQYRNKQCEMYSALAAGGNGAGDLRLACVAALNQMQAEELGWASHRWE